MTAHAKLSASGAHRWMNCPGSVRAEEGLKDSSSPFAEEGTKAHDLMEQMLLYARTDIDKYDIEMAEHVRTYVDYVESQKKPGDALFVEEAELQQITLSDIEAFEAFEGVGIAGTGDFERVRVCLCSLPGRRTARAQAGPDAP